MNARLFASPLVCLSVVLVACSSSTGSPTNDEDPDLSIPPLPGAPGSAGAADTGTTSQSLDAQLASRGFTVSTGKFAILDLTDCCDSSCEGNNPSSPYGAFYLPPAPGESPEAGAGADGLATAFHFREDEAIVFVGPTPPTSSYFGFTPYLATRETITGGRRQVAASLSETLNDLVIGVNAPDGSTVFGQQTAIVVAADQITLLKVTASLVKSGIPAHAINTLVLDPAVSHFGLVEAADTFSVLFRVAIPADQSALNAYLANPIGTLYRVTPPVTLTSNPLPSPKARPKNTSNTENALAPDVDALGAAIVAAYPGFQSEELSVDDGVPDPGACIDGTSVCAYDNRDTTYPQIQPRVIFPTDDDFYVVYGVNHQKTNKVTYANASIYGVQKLYGITSAASPADAHFSYPPDGNYGAGTVPDSDQLYSYTIARACNGEPYCLAIPAGSCPSGLDDGAYGTIAFRTYLEPSSQTAPDPSTLVRDRVKHFYH